MGLGLMGGSLGLALKARGGPGSVTGYARRPETRAAALQRQAVDAVCADPAEAVKNADLVVLCVPVLSMPALARACAPGLSAGSLVSDVGSTKAWLTTAMRVSLQGTGAVFVGSHPIAGSEQQGLEAGRADLYAGAVTVVTADGSEPAGAVERVQEFWAQLGAQVRVMRPEEHDRVMARTSHLPHVVAALLAATVGREGGTERIGPFCGPGFRDTTRVAEGSPDVWSDILQSNGPAVTEELVALKKKLDEVLALFAQDDREALRRFLRDSRASRQALRAALSQHQPQRGEA
ncbi:MAG: prephenate dehydrogenase/arogenate dehydrogenase family protein [Kiritimatiellaeota bacterium]|nr:prephenate dehydrogenase/arogenate dehydrogenase family protein [Kiritimatiellota bacterium]